MSDEKAMTGDAAGGEPVGPEAVPGSSATPAPATTPAAASGQRSRTSGWEVADKVAHGAGKAIDGVALVMMKLWGLALVLIGIVLLVLAFDKAWWAGFLLIGYGIYLLLPGGKFVVW